MAQVTKVITSAQPLWTWLCPTIPLYCVWTVRITWLCPTIPLYCPRIVRITKMALKTDHILRILGYLLTRVSSFLIEFVAYHLKCLPQKWVKWKGLIHDKQNTAGFNLIFFRSVLLKSKEAWSHTKYYNFINVI